MGKKGTTRVTAQDIAKFGEGGINALMKDLVKAANTGNQEIMEMAAGKLHSLADQNHHEHAAALFSLGAIPALVRVIDKGTAEGQSHAAGALYAIATGKPSHQAAIVAAGGVKPLVSLLRMGGAKVQEEVCSAPHCRHRPIHPCVPAQRPLPLRAVRPDVSARAACGEAWGEGVGRQMGGGRGESNFINDE